MLTLAQATRLDGSIRVLIRVCTQMLAEVFFVCTTEGIEGETKFCSQPLRAMYFNICIQQVDSIGIEGSTKMFSTFFFMWYVLQNEQ